MCQLLRGDACAGSTPSKRLLTDSPRAVSRAPSPQARPATPRNADPLGRLLTWAPKVIPNAVVLIAAVRLAFDVYNQFTVGSQNLIMALSSFLVVLAVCKLYEPKTVRNIGQIIALRFASDAELAALASRAAEEGMKPAEIKRAVKTWRADLHRV